MTGFDRNKAVHIKPWGKATLCMYYTEDKNYPIMIAECDALGKAALWTLVAAGDTLLYYRIYNGEVPTMALACDDFFQRGYPAKLQSTDDKKHEQYWVRFGTDEKTYFRNRAAIDAGMNLYLSNFPSQTNTILVGLLANETITNDDGAFWSIVKAPVPTTTAPVSSTTAQVPSTSTTSESKAASHDNANHSGQTIAIAVAIPVVLLLVAGAAFWFRRKRRHRKNNGQDTRTGSRKTEEQPLAGQGNMDDNAQVDDTPMEQFTHSRPSPAPERQQPQRPTTSPSSNATESTFPRPFAPGSHGSEDASSLGHIPAQSPALFPTSAVHDAQLGSATTMDDLGVNLPALPGSHRPDRIRGLL